MSDTQALAKRLDMGALIQQAVEHGSGVETLERLLAMAKDVRAEQARAAWHDAMAKFQAEAPVVNKSKKARVQTRTGGSYEYSYAPLEDLISAMRPVLAKYGLSVVFKTIVDKTHVEASADVAHQDGHVESCKFAVPIDLESRMNAAQQVGSACTYARRYAYLSALGLSPEDDDDAGNAARPYDGTRTQQPITHSRPDRRTQAPTPESAPVWRGKFAKMESKNGVKPNGEPWILWKFTGSDGEAFGTFSETVANGIIALEGRFLEVVYEVKKNGNSILEYRDVTQEEAPFA